VFYHKAKQSKRKQKETMENLAVQSHPKPSLAQLCKSRGPTRGAPERRQPKQSKALWIQMRRRI
jgi:hypothetical protein